MLIKNKKSGKLTYSIGQVSEYTELPQSVLRYWETVFGQLSPAKSPGGSRKYSDEDVLIIQHIKDLLYNKGYTIKGANKELDKEVSPPILESNPSVSTDPAPDSAVLQNVHPSDFRAVINRLKNIMDELKN